MKSLIHVARYIVAMTSFDGLRSYFAHRVFSLDLGCCFGSPLRVFRMPQFTTWEREKKFFTAWEREKKSTTMGKSANKRKNKKNRQEKAKKKKQMCKYLFIGFFTCCNDYWVLTSVISTVSKSKLKMEWKLKSSKKNPPPESLTLKR